MSKNEDKLAQGQVLRSQVSRQLLLQYILSLLGFAIGFLLFVFISWQISAQIIWQPENPLYNLLRWVKEYILFWIIAFLLTGGSIITYRFLQKPLRYLDEIVIAAEQLVQPDEEPIVLPSAMKNVQDELNLAKEQALRNAMLAKDAEQRKNDLIVYLAHDLKTPLTSVIGYLTLLRDEPQISQELRTKYTSVALGKAERLEDLINEFFDITRFSLSHLVLEPEKINLTRMVEQIAYEFNPVLHKKELHWKLNLTPDLHIICDPDKLERVIDNLIRNAVNYSYEKTDIAISLAQKDNNIHLSIQNHGKNISPEKLEKIFEQYYRLDSSRSTATGGVGLGLAIAKEITELHGGVIHAESDNGSILFSVQLPVDCQKNVRFSS